MLIVLIDGLMYIFFLFLFKKNYFFVQFCLVNQFQKRATELKPKVVNYFKKQ